MDREMVLFDSPRRILALLLLAACVVAVLPAATADAAKRKRAKADCANVDVQPTAANLADVRGAVLCLLNRERGARGLPALKDHGKLRRAAEGHSGDMVANRYFAHDSQSGADMVDRILGTGYGRGQSWSLGENIAWGTGVLATAAEIHKSWMESPGHRANILRRQFREIGIGIAVGAPSGSGALQGATYTADFGVRR